MGSKRKYLIIAVIAAVIGIASMVLFLTKKDDGKKEKEPERISTHTESQVDGQASTRTTEWFNKSVSGYIEKSVSKDFKLYSDVYNVKTGVNEDNVMLYVSANVSVYFNAEKHKENDISEFSDNFARELAKRGASGNIKLSAYVVPSSIYNQIEESNYKQVEGKPGDMDGYHKYSFNYTGPDVISKPSVTGNPDKKMPDSVSTTKP